MDYSLILSKFEFKTIEDLKNYKNSLKYFGDLINSSKDEINTINQKRLSSAEDAFKVSCSVILQKQTSKKLTEIYLAFLYMDSEIDDLLEIFVDSFFDIAHYRNNSLNATEDDKKLFSLFTDYHKQINNVRDFAFAMTVAFMSFYENPGITRIEKKSILTGELVPVLKKNLDSPYEILSNKDEALLEFLAIITQDLEAVELEARYRLYSFFKPSQVEAMKKMNSEKLQQYLAESAAENTNLREAKNIVKQITETGYNMLHIKEFMNSMKISEEDLKDFRKKFIDQQQAIDS
jgi:hypothetical protein